MFPKDDVVLPSLWEATGGEDEFAKRDENGKFIEWTRTSPNARFTEIARDATCWGCHAQAKRTDWVYTTR